MKKHAHIIRFLSALFLCAIVLPFAGSTGTAHAAEGISPAAYLSPDGYLNTPADFSGNFDLTDWQVSLNNERGVQIQPAAATIGGWGSLGGSGTGLNGIVYTLIMDNGVLYAGGSFSSAGGDPNANNIAKYTGGAWSSLGGTGTGLSDIVHALFMDGGVLYAGGDFENAGSDADADYVAEYKNGAWSSLGGTGTGLGNTVYTLVMDGGVLYAGGGFDNAGGDVDADKIAKYTAANGWESLGGSGTRLSNTVRTLVIDGGVIYAGGNFTDAGSDTDADYVAKYTTANGWASLNGVNTGLDNSVEFLLMDGGVLYAAGSFTGAGGDSDADRIAKFTGGAWTSLGGTGTDLSTTVNSLIMHKGVLYAGGYFTNAGSDTFADFVAKFTGGAWSSLNGAGTDVNGPVLALVTDENGVLYAGGSFIEAGSDADANYIAQYGLYPPKPTNVKATDGTSSAYVKVTWNSSAGATSYEIYRYNGSSWVKRATTSALFYKDTNTTPLATYKYRIKACTTGGCSGFSTLATGYRGKLVTAQLVRNLGFEIDTDKDGIPNFWTRASNNGLDKRICSPAAKYRGNCGYRFLGDGVAAKDWVRQNLSAKALAKGGGHNGDKLILSFYARSLRLELADGAYVLVKVRNSATNKQQVIRVNLTGTHAYKRFTKTLKVAIGNYDQVWVYVYANGTATENLYVDNISVRLQYIQKK